MNGGEKDTLFPRDVDDAWNAWNGTLFDAFSGRGCVAGQVESDPPPGQKPSIRCEPRDVCREQLHLTAPRPRIRPRSICESSILTINRFNWTSWIQLVPVTSCFQLVPVTSWIQLVPVTSISKPSWLNGFNWKFSNRNFLLGVNLKVKMTFKRYSVILDFVFTPMYSAQTCRYKSRKMLILRMRTSGISLCLISQLLYLSKFVHIWYADKPWLNSHFI